MTYRELRVKLEAMGATDDSLLWCIDYWDQDVRPLEIDSLDEYKHFGITSFALVPDDWCD